MDGLLGLAPKTERIYLAMLSSDTVAVRDLADTHPELTPEDRELAIGELLRRGLIRPDDRSEDRFQVVAPELALGGLVAEREEASRRLRAEVGRLQDLFAEHHLSARSQPTEVVPGAEAVERLYALLGRAEEQVRAFQRPPYSIPTSVVPQAELDGLARGVRFRVLHGTSTTETQPLETLRRSILAGEESRVIGEVPCRLVIIDDQFALLPERPGHRLADGMLVVRSQSLIEALTALFETYWAKALPLTIDTLSEAGRPVPEPARVPEDTALIGLLASGLADRAIARQLGVGLRTVQRRIQLVMRELHAASRFQAGVAVGRLLAQQQDRPVAASPQAEGVDHLLGDLTAGPVDSSRSQ